MSVARRYLLNRLALLPPTDEASSFGVFTRIMPLLFMAVT